MEIINYIKTNNLEKLKGVKKEDLLKDMSEYFFTALEYSNLDIVEYLIEQGADLNKKNDAYRYIPLTFLINKIEYPPTAENMINNDLFINKTKLLIDMGANVNNNYVDNYINPIIAALDYSLPILKYIFQHGGNIEQKLEDLETRSITDGYLMLCIKQGYPDDIIDILLDVYRNGTYSNVSIIENCILFLSKERMGHDNIEKILTMTELKPQLNITENILNQALLISISNKRTKIISIILEKKQTDVNYILNFRTPLIQLLSNKIYYPSYLDIINMLMNKGANINYFLIDESDNNKLLHPLTLSIQNFKNDINTSNMHNILHVINLLLSHGANVFIDENPDISPVKMVLDNNLIQVMKLFIKFDIDIDKKITEDKTVLEYVKLLHDESMSYGDNKYNVMYKLLTDYSSHPSIDRFRESLPKFQWNYSDPMTKTQSIYQDNDYEELLNVIDRYEQDKRFQTSFYNLSKNVPDKGMDYKGETSRMIFNLSKQLSSSTFLKPIMVNNYGDKNTRYLNYDEDSGFYNLNPDHKDKNIHTKIGKFLGMTIVQQLNLNIHFDPFLLYTLIHYKTDKSVASLSLDEMTKIIQSLETEYNYFPFLCRIDKDTVDKKKVFNGQKPQCKALEIVTPATEDRNEIYEYKEYDKNTIEQMTDEQILKANKDIMKSVLQDVIVEKIIVDGKYKEHVKLFCDGFYSIITPVTNAKIFSKLTVKELDTMICGIQTYNYDVLMSLLQYKGFEEKHITFLKKIIKMNYDSSVDKEQYIKTFVRALTGTDIIPSDGFYNVPLTLQGTDRDNNIHRCFNTYDINVGFLEESITIEDLTETMTYIMFTEADLIRESTKGTNQAGGFKNVKSNRKMSDHYLSKYQMLKEKIDK